MDILQQSGLALIQAFQQFTPTLDGLMKAITFLGSFEFYMLLIPFIYYVFDRGLGLRVLFILISTDVWSNFFKQLFHQPRPYWISTNVKAIATDPAYGLPSSHASNTLAVWGYIAYTVKRSWGWVLTSLLLLMIGISRLYLGVHFPHDVLISWLLGFVVLIIFIRSEKDFLAWWNRQSFSAQIGLGFAFSLVIILLGMLVRGLIASKPDPESWASFATGARGFSYYLTDSGALFGAIAGATLMQRYAPFQTTGPWWMRIARYVLGVLGVLVIYLGLDVLFGLIAVDDSILGYILRYIRYGSVTFWAIFIAPWIFIKIKLAET